MQFRTFLLILQLAHVCSKCLEISNILTFMPFFMHSIFDLLELHINRVYTISCKIPTSCCRTKRTATMCNCASLFGQSNPPSIATLKIFVQIYFSNGNSKYDIVYSRMRKGRIVPYNIFLSKFILVKDFNIF